MRIMETKVYTFNELSDKAKAYALDKNRGINTNFKWYDCLYDDCKQMLEFLGFSDIAINFSGFSSQGDGACFMGRYLYNPKWKEEFDKAGIIDNDFILCGNVLQGIQEKYDGQLMAKITKSDHHYSHENTVSIDIFHNENDKEIAQADEESIDNLMRNMMREIYQRLDSEYDYLTEDAQVADCLIANECEFTEEGRRI